MATVQFGAPNYLTAYTEGWVRTISNVSVVQGRIVKNGLHPIKVTQLYGYVGGRGASRTGTMYMGSASVGYSCGSAGSASGTGWLGTNEWYVSNGTTAQYGYTSLSGSTYFGRTANSGAVNIQGAYGTFAGSMAGNYAYKQAPLTPTGLGLVLSSTPGTVAASWTANADWGDGTPVGYRLFASPNADMSSATSFDFGVVTTGNATGLTLGQTWYFALAARNDVTQTASTETVWTATQSLFLPSGGKVWNGSIWTPGNTKVWNGSAWVTANVKVWNGTTWAPAS